MTQPDPTTTTTTKARPALEYQPRPSLPRRRGLLASLRAQPDTDVKLTDAAEVDRAYRYWRFRILATTLVGYALFYFVRTNISVALPRMGRDLGYTKAQLGVILTIGGVVYGISKFANGILGDLSNPRYFMAIGLLVSAAMNVLFGLSSALVFLGAFWFLNNWAQGMGFPPCARSMGHWFSPKERGTTFGIWHTGHMIGAALVSVMTGYLVVYDWRLCFFVPAGLAVLGAIMIVFGLRDHPGSMGLPPVEVYRGEETPREVNEEIQPERPYREILVQYVFCNPFLWVISVANFFVYTLRYAGLHWGPTQLQEMKGMSPQASGWVLFGFEIAGLVSAIVGGLLADRLFRGRAGRVCFLSCLVLTAAVYLFWITAHPWLASFFFILMGFTIYVPQMLIAAMAMNLGTKRASAAAVGLTGILGYLSSILSGYGVGKIVDLYNWDGAFYMLLGCAGVTALLMLTTWNVGAHPQAPAEARGFEVGPAGKPAEPELAAK